MSNNVKLQEDLPMLLVCFKQYIYSSKITLKNYLKCKGIMQSASGLQKKKGTRVSCFTNSANQVDDSHFQIAHICLKLDDYRMRFLTDVFEIKLLTCQIIEDPPTKTVATFHIN